MGFVDKDAVEELNKAVADALRPIGVTVAAEPALSFDPGSNSVVLQIVAIVGESAFEKLGQTEEQKQARQEMQKVAKQQSEDRVESIVDKTKEELAALLEGKDIFDDPLEAPCPSSEDGQHNMHVVENFCVNCNAGLE